MDEKYQKIGAIQIHTVGVSAKREQLVQSWVGLWRVLNRLRLLTKK